MAKALILSGLILATIGVVLQFAPWLVSWFGRLPGDIRRSGENVSVFIPIASMIIVSVALTLAMNILGRFLNR